MRTSIRVCAALLSLVAAPLHAAALCDGGPCSISIAFGDGGGTLATTQGATITFGAGGSLVLGEGGSISGAAVTPDDGDMSNGGSVVLQPGGSIQFGPSGSLATADGGEVSIADGSALDVQNAVSASVVSDYPVQLGTLDTDGTLQVTADEVTVTSGEPATPINVAMLSGDTSTQVSLTGPSVTFNQRSQDPGSGGSGGSSGGSTGSGCSSGSDGSITLSSGPDMSSCSNGPSSGEISSPGTIDGTVTLGTVQARRVSGGAPAALMLLLFAACGAIRTARRRSD